MDLKQTIVEFVRELFQRGSILNSNNLDDLFRALQGKYELNFVPLKYRDELGANTPETPAGESYGQVEGTITDLIIKDKKLKLIIRSNEIGIGLAQW